MTFMPPLTLLTRTAATLDENLALDEALLLAAEAEESGEVLRFWEWPTPAVVLGAGGSIAIDVNEDACRSDGVSIHRRASGGGTVLLGRGCLLYTLVLKYDRAAELSHVSPSYRWILGQIRDALQGVAAVEIAGISDLAVMGMKFSGNAQQRKARHVLHHGTLLYSFPIASVGNYLRSPERQPKYRDDREHASFLSNLTVDAPTLQQLIAEKFRVLPGDLATAVWNRVPGLIAERYGQAEWVRRR